MIELARFVQLIIYGTGEPVLPSGFSALPAQDSGLRGEWTDRAPLGLAVQE